MPKHPWKRRLLPALVAVAAMLAACAEKSADEGVASARAYAAKDDTAAAIVELKSALQRDPQHPQARFLLGQALLKSGNAAAAVVELEKAQDLQYDDNEVLPLLATALMAQGQAKKVTDLYSRARLTDPVAHAKLKATVAAAFGAQGDIERSQAYVDQALALDTKNIVARLLQARLTAGRGDMDGALKIVESVLGDDPKQREAWQLKGEILWVGKRDAAAGREAFLKAVEVEPKYVPAHAALITLALQRKDIPAFKAQVETLRKVLPGRFETRLYEAQAALIDKDLKTARDITQQLLRAAPDSALALQLAGAIELRAGSLALAESHLAKALQFDPRLVVARRLLAQVYLQGGQPARAISLLQVIVNDRRADAETLSLLAEAYLQNGQFAESEAHFARAAQLKPDDAKIQTALALSQIAKGDAPGGLAALEALAVRDNSTYADLALISAQLRRGELDAALRSIERLQNKEPEAALPHLLRGRILLQRKDAAAARASFEKALAVDPGYYAAAAALAALDLQDKQIDRAVKRFEDQLARDPRNYRALLAVAQLRLQSGAPPQQVRTLLEEAVKANPNELAPRLMLIDYLLSRNETDAARTAAQDAASKLPEQPELLDALGRAQVAAGDLQQGISAFGKLAAAQPDSALAQLRLADAHMRNKDVAAARRSLQRALQIDPRSLPAQAAQIELALRDKRHDEALAVARTGQQQRPKEAAGYHLEADIAIRQRQWAPAIATLRAALQRDNATRTAMRLHATLTTAGRSADADTFAAGWVRDHPADVDFLVHLGTMAMEAKTHARAEKYFRDVLAQRPDDPAALNNLSWVLLQQKKPGALEMAQKANQLEPDNPAFMDTLAAALAADGQLAQAIELQRKALAAARAPNGYRLRLARLLLQSGDRAAARAELDVLAALGDRFADQAEVAALLKETP